MILAGFRIRIKDFWLCDLSTRFPKNSFKIVDIHPLKDGAARGILEVSGSADVNQISKFIGEQNEIKTVSTLVDDEDALLLSFYFTHGPLAKVLVSTDIHIRPPIFLEKGTINVNVIGKEDDVLDFLQNAKDNPEIDIQLMKKMGLQYFSKPVLTEKQEQIIKLAIELGYYDVPRKINTEELAKRLKLSPSTLGEHLRKAEERLIKGYF